MTPSCQKYRFYRIKLLTMLGQPPRSSSTEALKSLDLKSLSTRRFFHRCIAIYKCLIGEADFNFNFTKTQAVHSYNTRRSNDIRLPLPRKNWGKQTYIFHAAKDWNSLPNDLKECNILSIFKSKLKTFFKRSQLILNLDIFCVIDFKILIF